MLTATSLVAHLGNYLFYLVSARQLNPGEFAEVTSLTALATIVFMPFNGVQAAGARDVARLAADGESSRISGLTRRLFRQVLTIQGGLLLAMVLAAPLLSAWLKIDSLSVVLAASLWIVLTVALPALMGPLQGLGRFGIIAFLLAGPLGAFRAVFVLPAVPFFGVSGAFLALIAATVIGLVVVTYALRQHLRRPDGATDERLTDIGWMIVSLIAFSALTNADIIAAKASLPSDVAGTYASAALIGKIALYVPAAISLVLLPRATALIERGGNAFRPVWLTLVTVALIGVSVTLGMAVLPDSVITTIFGPDYAAATNLIVPLSAVMTVAAVLNVHLTLSLASQERAFPLLLMGVALLHIGLLSVWHSSPEAIVVDSAIAIGLATVLHELMSDVSVRRLARLGRVKAG